MALSKRERIIGLSAAGVLALLALDRVALTPLFAQRTELLAQTQTTAIELDRAKQLRASATRIDRRWNDMVAAGLKSQVPESESQAMRALHGWAREAGLALISLQPDRVEHATRQKDFQQITLRVSGTGTMATAAQFLWHIETTTIPMRVIALDLNSRKDDGTDDLSLNLTVSTICLAPPAKPAPSRPAVAVAVGGEAAR